MRNFLRTFLLLATISSWSAAQYAYLNVQHPQQTWRYGQGTVERATIAIHPKGLYTEHDLYMDFSARGLSFSSTDSVEVQYNFDLPDGAIVTDLWLWIGSDIMKAYIMDRWTASTIYESIVKRRRDPAILTKEYGNRHSLRIYPMAGNETRRIKMTYLVPNAWSSRRISSTIPTHLFRASKYLPNKLSLLFWPASGWDTPKILERTSVQAAPRVDSAGAPFFELTVPGDSLQTALTLSWPSPMQNGVYVNRQQNGPDGIYQFALIPSQALGLKTARKVAILFDFDPTKSTMTAADVIATTRALLLDNLTAADSINLIFSRLPAKRVSSGWIGGDSASVVAAFDSAGSSPLSSYSNLPALLADGIDFVRTHGNDGSLWLIANTDQVGDYPVANPLLNDVMKLMNPALPVHVSDFNNTNTRYFYISGTYYYGNGYFYENLARMTKGSNKRISYSAALSSFLPGSFSLLRGSIETFDIYTTVSNGFCYGRQSPNFVQLQSVGIDDPLVQAGKFNGSFPLVIEVTGRFRDSLFSRRITVQAQSADTGDAASRQIWAGMYIGTLDKQPGSNELTRQIVLASLADRVLSRYTAFLALEKSDTILACASCVDESKYTGVTEQPRREIALDSLLQAYPNPFNAQTTLRVTLPGGVMPTEASLVIYNVLGQVVQTLDLTPLGTSSSGTVRWNGMNDANKPAASGVYVAVLTTPKGRASTKLLMLK